MSPNVAVLPGAAAWALIASVSGLFAALPAAANDEAVEPTLPVERIPSTAERKF